MIPIFLTEWFPESQFESDQDLNISEEADSASENDNGDDEEEQTLGAGGEE